jgi:hypothetical protein
LDTLAIQAAQIAWVWYYLEQAAAKWNLTLVSPATNDANHGNVWLQNWLKVT